MKVCTKCKLSKHESEFSKNRRERDGLEYWCKACNILRIRIYHDTHQEKIKTYYTAHNALPEVKARKAAHAATPEARARANAHNALPEVKTRRAAYNRQRNTGCSQKLYAELFAMQGGVCAICGQPPNSKSLGADHDHKTGKIRGLLCYHCNVALGLIGDNPTIVHAMAAYLEQWQAKQHHLAPD